MLLVMCAISEILNYVFEFQFVIPAFRIHLLLLYTLCTQGHCLRVANSLRKIYLYIHVLYRRIKTDYFT